MKSGVKQLADQFRLSAKSVNYPRNGGLQLLAQTENLTPGADNMQNQRFSHALGQKSVAPRQLNLSINVAPARTVDSTLSNQNHPRVSGTGLNPVPVCAWPPPGMPSNGVESIVALRLRTLLKVDNSVSCLRVMCMNV